MIHTEALTEHSKKIFPLLPQFPGFCLAGGTALALQIGHRVSVDFDFFSERQIEKSLLEKVKKIFAGFSVSVSVNDPGELTIFVGETKLTFLYYPFPVLFPTVAYGGVAMLSVPEIAATKAYTIGRRGSYKDYVDLYFIISEKFSALEEIIRSAEKKYRNEFNSRLFLEQLIYLDDIEDTGIMFLRDGPGDKAAIDSFFTSQVKKLTL